MKVNSILTILCIGIILIPWSCPSYAAQLKDIRVGEYETHTRIVFEYGDTLLHETIQPLASGQLSVLFPDTELDLIRKIPIDRSKRIKEIKIWQHRNALSLVLTFAFEHFRYELSKFDQPKRLVLDVYQMTPPATRSVSENNMSDQPVSAPEAPTFTETIESDQPHVKALDPPRLVRTPEPPSHPPARPGRMQRYLVIALVMLTLAILVLLLVMLISKNHWTNSGSPNTPNRNR